MERNRSDAVNGLTRKGFTPKVGDHVMFLYTTLAGKKTAVRTRISHSDRKLNDGRLRQVAKQVHLTVEDLVRLIDCPLDRVTYEATLVAEGHIEVEAEN